MNDNQIKSINGQISKNSLSMQLQLLQTAGVIAFCSMEYRNGYVGYDSQQFYAPFYIEFQSGEGWLLFPSNSIRNDRMNNQQWNSLHLKQIEKNITRAYLVIPDDISIKEKKTAAAYQKKITGSMYSSIEDVCYQSEIIDMIERHSKNLPSNPTKYLPSLNPTIHEDIAAEPTFVSLLIGCYKNDEHLKWILGNRIYNVRLNKRKGAVLQTYIANKATKLLLYNQKNHQIFKYFNLSGEIEKAGAEKMIALQYPDYQQGREYLLYRLNTEISTPKVNVDNLIEKYKPANWVLYSPIFISFNGIIEDLEII